AINTILQRTFASLWFSTGCPATGKGVERRRGKTMTFDEVLAQMVELLQREGRVTYRSLKRRFALDDDYLEDLKGEIIKAKRLAVDEAGEVLVWVGASGASSSQLSAPSISGAEFRTPALNTQTRDA